MYINTDKSQKYWLLQVPATYWSLKKGYLNQDILAVWNIACFSALHTFSSKGSPYLTHTGLKVCFSLSDSSTISAFWIRGQPKLLN